MQKWIKAKEAADMLVGKEGVVIIRQTHNGKEATIRQLRPTPKMSPASVTSHLDWCSRLTNSARALSPRLLA